MGGAATPCSGAVRARVVVARWGRVVSSGGGGGEGSARAGGGGGGGGGGDRGGAGGGGAGGDCFGAVGSLQDPLAFRWGLGVGHRLRPFGLYGLVESGGGSGAGLDGDRGRRVPRPRVSVPGGGGHLWGVDGAALPDWDVDEGLDGVVLCGRLRGGGSRLGGGELGFGGCGVLAWVRVRVGVRARPLMLLLRLF